MCSVERLMNYVLPAPYIFDLPASVAQAMDGSLSAVMDVSSPEYKKKGNSAHKVIPLLITCSCAKMYLGNSNIILI